MPAAKLLSHFVPRRGAEKPFAERICAELGRLRGDAGAALEQAVSMFRLEDDSFGRNTRFQGALELRAADRGALVDAVGGLAERLGDTVHADLCTALVGVDRVFIPCVRAPVRYQYLMRRNAAYSHAAYIERYSTIHAKFGLETPGILGYTQFHVDPEASRRAAASAGFGVWGVDSVAELHLESAAKFLEEIAKVAEGHGAVEDEEIFVDRPNSHDFVSRVDWPDAG